MRSRTAGLNSLPQFFRFAIVDRGLDVPALYIAIYGSGLMNLQTE